jgi:hypothetical protein
MLGAVEEIRAPPRESPLEGFWAAGTWRLGGLRSMLKPEGLLGGWRLAPWRAAEHSMLSALLEKWRLEGTGACRQCRVGWRRWRSGVWRRWRRLEKWRLAAGEVGVWRLEKWRTGVWRRGLVARETGGRRRLEKWRLAA